jgi:FAD/FMN-containing dehydrogenase
VGGGALWADVYEETQKFGLDVVGAYFWFTGVAGFLLGGGYGPLSGEHGLGLDNVLAATVVLADGQIVQTSESEETDLFWAIRGEFSCINSYVYWPDVNVRMPGGGDQFGIVVEFVLKTFLVAPTVPFRP